MRERFVGAGFETPPSPSAAQLAQSVRAEYERNGALVKAYAIKLNQ